MFCNKPFIRQLFGYLHDSALRQICGLRGCAKIFKSGHEDLQDFWCFKMNSLLAVPGLFTRLCITSNLRLYAVLRGIPGFNPGNPV